MKKSLLILFLALFALVACKKAEQPNPEPAQSVIPTIQEYMPTTLLDMMSEYINHGDDFTFPEGTQRFIINDMVCEQVHYVMPDLPIHPIISGSILGDSLYLSISSEGETVAEVQLAMVTHIINPENGTVYTSYCNFSNPDSTVRNLQANPETLSQSQYVPAYLKSSDFKIEDLSKAYIIGSGDGFTIYYYDVQCVRYDANWPYSQNDYKPVIANIITGRLISNGIEMRVGDMHWGKECIGYISDSQYLTFLIENGNVVAPGDAWILSTDSDCVSTEDWPM